MSCRTGRGLESSRPSSASAPAGSGRRSPAQPSRSKSDAHRWMQRTPARWTELEPMREYSRGGAGLRRAATHPGEPLALSTLRLGACLLAATHEGLVPLVVAQDSAALHTLLETAEEAIDSLPGPRNDFHSFTCFLIGRAPE